MPGFAYAIPIEPAQLLIGEDFQQKVLRDFLLDHLHLETIRDATVNQIRIDRQIYSLISPAWQTGPAPITYDESTQDWATFPIGDDREIKIGWVRDRPPGPADLERTPAIRGYSIETSPGHSWIIPIARPRVSRETTLPTDCTFDLATGQVIRKRKPKHEQLWELSGRVWEYWNDKDDTKEGQAEFVLQAALQSLQANYRISHLELNAFVQMGCGVLDDVHAASISLALIDMDLIHESNDAKKNIPDA